MAASHRSTSPRETEGQNNERGFLSAMVALSVRNGYRLSRFMSRRPHRSFLLTRRRDYKRQLIVPKYWALLGGVLRVISRNKRALLMLTLLYAALQTLFIGMTSQADFTTLRDSLYEAGSNMFSGNWSDVTQTVSLAMITIFGGASHAMTGGQRLYIIFFSVLIWLSTVWLLRQRLANHQVSVRDALYNSGAPVMAMGVLVIVAVIQLIPAAVGLVIINAASQTGMLSGGIEAMLLWLAVIGLVTISIYCLISTAFATIIVTNPGVYPLRALRIAGDIVTGRRLQVILRFLWLAIIIFFGWLLVLLPVLALDSWLVSTWDALAGLSIVPFVILLLGSLTFVFSAVYIYIFYREVIRGDAHAER